MKALLVVLFALGLFVNQLSNTGMLSPAACKLVDELTEKQSVSRTIEIGGLYKTAKLYSIAAICKI